MPGPCGPRAYHRGAWGLPSGRRWAGFEALTGSALVSLPRPFDQVRRADNVVPIEDRPGLVPTETHGHRLAHACADQPPNRTSSQVVEDPAWQPCASQRRLPGPAEALDRATVLPGEDERDDARRGSLKLAASGPPNPEKLAQRFGEGEEPALAVLCRA